MSNNYTDVTKPSLIINKLTRAQYEASSKDENQLWILTDVIDFQADLTENIYAPSKKYEGQITQHIGETSGKYIQGYFYKCVAVGEEPDITYVWQNINSQPAQVLNWGNIGGTLSDQSDLQGALDSKLTTTDGVSKVYGTNAQGEQTTYDVNSFGQVDDVQVDGVSVVTNKIADIDLTGKVDKVNTASKVYGTDENGDQTTYSVNDFGQIDNVAIHGIDQTITDKRVDLKVVEQEDSLPTASEDLVGIIVQYTGTTTQDYTHGYFYECKVSGAPSEAVCTATDSSTLYPYHITIDKDTFETQITTSGEYVFNYDGTDWTLSGTAVDLADYGISIQEGITYSSGDNMYIQYTESTIGYFWSPVSVQTSTVFRRIVEE